MHALDQRLLLLLINLSSYCRIDSCINSTAAVATAVAAAVALVAAIAAAKEEALKVHIRELEHLYIARKCSYLKNATYSAQLCVRSFCSNHACECKVSLRRVDE
jgi:hypothetical protein